MPVINRKNQAPQAKDGSGRREIAGGDGLQLNRSPPSKSKERKHLFTNNDRINDIGNEIFIWNQQQYGMVGEESMLIKNNDNQEAYENKLMHDITELEKSHNTTALLASGPSSSRQEKQNSSQKSKNKKASES